MNQQIKGGIPRVFGGEVSRVLEFGEIKERGECKERGGGEGEGEEEAFSEEKSQTKLVGGRGRVRKLR